MSKVNKNTGNCVTSFASCVKWDREGIPCLGIKNGDFLDDITFIIADKICDLAKPLDLSTISLQCLLDKGLITQEPLTKTISSLLQIAINNSCTLKDAITAIEAKLNGTTSSLNLNLKCLSSYFTGSSGEILPYTEKEVLQSIISEVCLLKQNYSSLLIKVNELETKVNNWQPPALVEPRITSCLFSSVPTSQAVTILASDYCAYKTLIGGASDVQKATSRTCSNANTLYQSFPGWIPVVTNYMQQANNYEIIICDLLSRITAIETGCCAITCDSVKTGFTIVITDSELFLNFRDIDGTKIPTGFTDCGSTYTITSPSNSVGQTGSLTITQGYISAAIPLSAFTKGEKLTVKVLSSMCNGTLTCSKCNSKEVSYSSNCCVLTNIGEGEVSIIYTINTIEPLL